MKRLKSSHGSSGSTDGMWWSWKESVIDRSEGGDSVPETVEEDKGYTDDVVLD